MKLTKTYPLASFKALEDEGPGKFQAVVSVFGNVDLQGDRVMPGAFNKSLAKWRAKGDPIPVVWSHDWLNPDAFIGEIDPNDAMEIAKSDSGPGGLLVKGVIDVHKPFAAQVFDLLKSRRVKEYSFAYDTEEEEQDKKDGANNLLELDIIEVGPTLKGANPETYTVSAKSAMEAELKEAYETQRSLGHFIDLIKTVEDPTIANMLTKTMMKGTTPRETHRFHVEKQGEKFACVSNQTGLNVDTHADDADAKTHVERLEKGDFDSARDDAIRKALGLEPLVVEPVATEEATPEPETDVEAKATETPEDEGTGAESKPWRTEKQGDEFCCILEEDGSTVDCHETQEESEAHIRALYANAADGEAEGEKLAQPPAEVPEVPAEEPEVPTEEKAEATDYSATTTSSNGYIQVDTTSTTSSISLETMIEKAVEKALEKRLGKADDETEVIEPEVKEESPTEWLERLLEGDK